VRAGGFAPHVSNDRIDVPEEVREVEILSVTAGAHATMAEQDNPLGHLAPPATRAVLGIGDGPIPSGPAAPPRDRA